MHPATVRGTLKYPKATEVLKAAGETERLADKLKRRTKQFFEETLKRGENCIVYRTLDGAVIGTNKYNTKTSRLRLFYEDPDASDEEPDDAGAPIDAQPDPDRGTSGDSNSPPLRPPVAPIGVRT